ncbi:MAG: Gfo/Idh/MocA family oxidoreductase [Chloroflexi bacterium]|nr:Gfo/Idh/MocA family oxidoreductase [Chloroflexota bacterium]
MAQEPLRVALIGTGFGTQVHLPAFLGLAETNVVALCGTDEGPAREIAARYGVRAVYTDYEQMLVDVQPDIVSVAAPPPLHNPITVAALQTGAHVLCEKPLALNAAEASEMLAEAEQRQRVHVVDFQTRYLPARYYQRVLTDQGYVGEPVLLEATWMTTTHWERALPWTWWMDADQLGGILSDMGTHLIDAFCWLSGRRVCAVTATLHTTPQYAHRRLPDGGERAVTADDAATLVLEFEGGLRGAITLSAAAAGETQRLALHGTEGALVVEDHLRLCGRRRGEALALIEIPQEYEPPLWLPDENLMLGPFARLAGLMVDAIRDRALIAPPTFADGLAVQRVLDAAYQSSREGRRVEIEYP